MRARPRIRSNRQLMLPTCCGALRTVALDPLARSVGWRARVHGLRCRSEPYRRRPRRTNEPHARVARSSPVRAEQLYPVAGRQAESRARIVQQRERGGSVCGGVRRPAALFDSLGSRRRLSDPERLMDRLTNTVRFLRMAASELRRLAERIPE